MVKRHLALDVIIALGQHTQSHDVGCGMPSSLLGTIHGWTTSGVACHHRSWEPYTVRCLRVSHAIIALGKHTQLDYVGRGMPSSP